MKKPRRATAEEGLDTREVPLEAPADTPSPLRDAYEAIAHTLFDAWGMRQRRPTVRAMFENEAWALSEAWRASRKKYQAGELFLQAEAEGRCAHQEALNVIMKVNDACGHIMKGNIPFDQASNYLKALPPFDLAKLLRAMRRQTSRAALRVQKTDAASQLSDEKEISGKAKLTSRKKRSQNQGVRNAKREARDQWIYQRCCQGLPHKKVVGLLSDRCQRKGWDRIRSVQGIRSAAIKYAERRNLPKPASRKNL